MMPELVLRDEPLIAQYFTVLLQASLMKRMAETPPVIDAVVLLFVMTRSRVLPVAFTLPSIVTLVAPFKFINGAKRFPLTDNPVTVG